MQENNMNPQDCAANLLSFSRDGVVVVPEMFNAQEVALVARDFQAASAVPSPKLVLEDSGEIRSLFLEKGDAPSIDVFVRQKRLLELAEAMLGSRVYAYQVKVNSKKALSGDLWPWHQDYVFWREKDGLPTPQILTAGVLLDDATEFCGPMYFVPGSHRDGVLQSLHREAPAGDYTKDLAKDLSYQLTSDVLVPLAKRLGMVSATGKAGSVVFFDCNIAHCSPNNLSPFDRRILFITYCSVDNVPAFVPRRRPNFLSNRDPSPLAPLDPDAFPTQRRI